MAVSSGELESALVLGVEKMTDMTGHEVTAALATAADADYEVEMGVSFVGLNALVMRRYMHEYGWKHADFAPFAINAHANALKNPYARLHQKITLEDFEKAAMIASPINLLDAPQALRNCVSRGADEGVDSTTLARSPAGTATTRSAG